MTLASTCLATLTLVLPLHAAGQDREGVPEVHRPVTVRTLVTTRLVIEGLTNDRDGNLYAPERETTPGQRCPVWRTSIDAPALTLIGLIPPPSETSACSPNGLAFGPDGMLYVTQADRIYRFTPDGAVPPNAHLFASGVPGANGLAFDRDGNLWTGDGTTGQGRVWKISPAGIVTEMFRIQPMANEVNLVNGTGGVGRDVRTLPLGTITVTPTTRNAANTLGSQPLVANGLAFTRKGDLLVADSARGALWLIELDANGQVESSLGCDTTFHPQTLCLENLWVAHPLLEGLDGIVLDVAGGVWGVDNERNAIVYVGPNRAVTEVFRNPPDAATQLRNGGPLESPASPVLVNNRFCTSNSDGSRRDNSPNTAGEIGGAGQHRGKISCIEQRINVDGVPLPTR